MKILFDKNEVIFAVVLIVIYVVGSSLMQRVSEAIGIAFLAETVFVAAMSILLLVFIRRNGLMRHLGLCRSDVPAVRMWLYLPLILLAARGMLFGIGTEEPVQTLILRTVMMLCVGFLEEIIFRGFLFKGIARENLTRAVVISALTFSIGHIVNLLNGYDLFDSVTQIVYAAAVGFLLVLIFLRTGSLLACIGFHALNNILTGFTSAAKLTAAVGERPARMILLAAGLVMIAVYALFAVRTLPPREITD